MPVVQVDPTLTMYYEDDYFGAPWRTPGTVLLIHGVAESSAAWYAWVPHLAAEHRVLRPDQRGFGRSTVPPADFPWSPARFAADLAHFLAALGVGAVHVVGAKFGGAIALQFAADYPAQTRTLTLLGAAVKAADTTIGRVYGGGLPGHIREAGVTAWAAETMRSRLGSQAPEEMVSWWTQYMGRANQQVCIGVTTAAGRLDMYPLLPRIQAPTLVVTTDRSPMRELDKVREWQMQIGDSALLVLPDDSYHVAAARAHDCARHFLSFVRNRE